LLSLLLPLVLLSLASANAAAYDNAVLFIDTNNNPGEIRAARQAVAARNAANPNGPQEVLVAVTASGVMRYEGETLSGSGGGRRLSGGKEVEIRKFNQELSEGDRAQLERLNSEIAEVNRRFSGLAEGSDQFEELQNQYNALVREQRQYTTGGAVNHINLEQVLGDLSESGLAVSSLVLSGHQADRGYFGVSGGVTRDQLVDLFSQERFADHNDSLLSMVIPACYSCTVGTSSVEWDGAFPNREFTFGYNPLAPLGTVESGHHYIFEMLSGEAELREHLSAEDGGLSLESLSQMLSSMVPVGVENRAAVCMDGSQLAQTLCPEMYSNNPDGTFEIYFADGVARCIDLEVECNRIYTELQAIAPVFESYNRGERQPGAPETDSAGRTINYNNPPTTTSRSRLRSFYNLVNDYLNCSQATDDEGNHLFETEGVPEASAVISLIYFQKVRDNFLRVHGDDLAESVRGLEYILAKDRERIDGLQEAGTDAGEIARLEARHSELRQAVAGMRDLLSGGATRREVVETSEQLLSWYNANREAPAADYDLLRTSSDWAAIEPGEVRANQTAVFWAYQAIDDHLVSFTEGCIPGGWLETVDTSRSGCDDERLYLGTEVYQSSTQRAPVLDRDLIAITSRIRELDAAQAEIETRARQLADAAGLPGASREVRMDALFAGLQNEALLRELDALNWERELNSIRVRRGEAFLQQNYQAELRASEFARARFEGMSVLTEALSGEMNLSEDERAEVARRVLLELNGQPVSQVVAELEAQLQSLTEVSDARYTGYAEAAIERLQAEDGRGRLAELIGIVDANGEILASYTGAVQAEAPPVAIQGQVEAVEGGGDALVTAIEAVLDDLQAASPAAEATCAPATVNAICVGVRARTMPVCRQCSLLTSNQATQAMLGGGN
jgi:hypothetical protein